MKPAVLLRNLHPEAAQLRQAAQHLGRHLPGAVDGVRVDLGLQEGLKLRKKGVADGAVVGALLRIRQDEVAAQPAQEELL